MQQDRHIIRCKYCCTYYVPQTQHLSAASDCRLAHLIQREKKSYVMMLVIVAAFMVCWAPASVLYLVRNVV
jgi:hypothetical protein